MSEESPVLKFPHYFYAKKTILGDIFFVVQIVVLFVRLHKGTLCVRGGGKYNLMGLWFAFVMMN